MAEEKGGSWSLPWPTVLTIVTLIGGVSAFFTPLVSSRPSGAAAKSTFTLGDQSVDARLWQDPLVPTQQHYDLLQWRAEKQGSTTQPSALVKAELLQRQIGRLTREIARKTRGGQRLLILPIMISGGPYPEDAESRLRTRHAVLSALSMAMFRPEDGEHLGYVAVPWPRELTEGAAPPALNDPLPSEPPLVIPYEWCRNIGPHRGINSTQPAARPDWRNVQVSLCSTYSWSRDNVLILWLQEDAFRDKPLLRLSQLFRALELPTRSAPDAIDDPVGVSIIGPRSSTLVKSMIEEAVLFPYAGLVPTRSVEKTWIGGINPPLYLELRNATMYSPTSTTEGSILTYMTDWNVPEKWTLAWEIQLAQRFAISFRRTIVDDRRIATELIRELARRGVDASRDDIAVVAEWDTLYGRALPQTFAAVSLSQPTMALLNNEVKWRRNLHSFTYLRGIDGQLPGDGVTRERAKESPQGTWDRARQRTEVPAGQNQTDYLRALASRLQALDRNLRAQPSGNPGNDKGPRRPGLRAVAVLGSDVYDKLLVLQSLRAALPGSIFVTTDMDARLLLPEEWRSTHNLIVASAFGLSLNDDYQRGIPPFRDTYQTSTFCTTLKALNLIAEEPTAETPRLYEIGRSGALDLSTASSHLSPPREMPGSIWTNYALVILGVLLILALLIVLWCVQHRRFRRALELRGLIRHTAPFLIIVCPLALLMIWLGLRSDWLLGEPLVLFDGVSLWGTLALRLVGACLAVHFIYRAFLLLRENFCCLDVEYRLGGDDSPSKKRRGMRPWMVVVAMPAVCVLGYIMARGSVSHSWASIALAGPLLLLGLVAAPIQTWRKSNMSGHGASKSPPHREPRTWKHALSRPYRFISDEFKVICNHWPEATGQTVNAVDLWRDYGIHGAFTRRIRRLWPSALLYVLLGACVRIILGTPTVPYRGGVARSLESFILFLSVAAFVILLFFVVDATRLCERLIERLMLGMTQYPTPLLDKAARSRGMKWEQLDPYLDIQLIAQRTEAVSPLIYYPFIILSLMLVARNSYFDNFDWPLGLLAIFLVGSVYAIACAVALRRTAEEARATALKRLEEQLRQVFNDPEQANRLESAILEIRAERRGAFASPLHHPILGAILIPSSGLGISALLDYFAKSY